MNAPALYQQKTYLESLLPIMPNGKVDARGLHKYLESGQKFTDWIKGRIAEYGFVEGVDYDKAEYDVSASEISEAGIPLAFEAANLLAGSNKTDYRVSIDMAKELGMVERTEKGREVRRYFLACEKLLHQKVEDERQHLTRTLDHVAAHKGFVGVRGAQYDLEIHDRLVDAAGRANAKDSEALILAERLTVAERTIEALECALPAQLRKKLVTQLERWTEVSAWSLTQTRKMRSGKGEFFETRFYGSEDAVR